MILRMLFDSEADILMCFRDTVSDDSPVLFNGNSFNKRVLNRLLNESVLTADYGHDAPPPDYYSKEYNLMFDVFRINDSEIKKSNNPVKRRERDAYHQISDELGDIFDENMPVYISSESDDAKEHSYRNYVRNAQRVIGEHIKKIPLWNENLPDRKSVV